MNLGSMSLVGDNVILRMFNLEDVKDVFNAYYNNPLNFEFESKKSVKTYDELITIINKKLDNYRRTNYYDYIITLNDNSVIGEISIPYYDDLFKTVEVRLIYNDNYINYIKEALVLFMEFIFEEVNANRIEFKVRLTASNKISIISKGKKKNFLNSLGIVKTICLWLQL